VLVTQDQNMIEELAPQRPDEPLRERVHVRRAHRSPHVVARVATLEGRIAGAWPE
jgi:hypothetical protein